MRNKMLKLLRDLSDMKQRDVGQSIGKSTMRISRIERGEFPIRESEARELAKLFGVKAELFISEDVSLREAKKAERRNK